MSKIILLALIGWVIYILIKRIAVPKIKPPNTQAIEDIVQCAYCGVYSPKRGSFLIHHQYYCCEDHSKQASE